MRCGIVVMDPLYSVVRDNGVIMVIDGLYYYTIDWILDSKVMAVLNVVVFLSSLINFSLFFSFQCGCAGAVTR